MKKILAIIVATLLTVQLFSNNEPKWKNEADNFFFFLENIVKRKAGTFNDDIKIQLKGEFSKADSANMQNMVATLRPLIQSVKIYFVKKGGNAIIEIHNTVKKYDWKKSLDKIEQSDSQYDYLYQLSYIGAPGQSGMESSSASVFINTSKINRFNFSIAFYSDCPQELRNKFLSNYFISRLLILNENQPSKIKVKPIVDFEYPLGGDSITRKSFNELDKYNIYHAYLKWPSLHFLLHHPEYYSAYVINYWGAYYYIFVYSLAFLMILVYILILFRLGIIQKPVHTYKGFIYKGMLILQSFQILSYVDLIFCTGFIGENYTRQLVTLFATLFVFNTLFFISLSLIYFLEKWLIKKNATMANKLVIQLFTTILPFCISFIIAKIDYSSIYIVFYAFVFVIARIGYNYIFYQSQEMIMQKDVELANMRELQHKTELQALHSRINPHFLYNALNSIAGMAKTDPPKTEHMALALSDFCRYAINKQDETYATVEDEVAVAATYLEIEKTRFGEKLQYSIEVADDCKVVSIPRFIIQPLLENAVKHGVSKITDVGIIKLKINTHNDNLVISVTDNGPAFPQLLTTGYGLQSIHDKLEILYQGAARLNWEQEPEKKISIFIPLSAAKPKQE